MNNEVHYSYTPTDPEKHSTGLTLTAHGRTVNVTFDAEDLTLDDWVDAFRACLVGVTFHPETVNSVQIVDNPEDYE